MNPAESTAAAVVVGIVLCAFAFSPAALAQRPGLARPTCPGGELPKCSCPPGTNVPYAGAHGCYDSEEFMYMKACKCDDGTDAQRPALLNLVGGAAGRRELQVMNQIFECADGGGLSSCTCASGAVAAPIPGLCVDVANNRAVVVKACACAGGAAATARTNAGVWIRPEPDLGHLGPPWHMDPGV